MNGGIRYVVNGLAILALSGWIGATSLLMHYDATRPTSDEPNLGRVYAWNTHGHIVFLTKAEQLRLYVIGGAGVASSLACFTVWFVNRSRKNGKRNAAPS